MSLRQDFVAVNEVSLNLRELIVSVVAVIESCHEDKDLTVLKLASTLAKQFVAASGCCNMFSSFTNLTL